MKIFVGGVNSKHREQFERRWPNQYFEFGIHHENPNVWARKAARADHVLVFANHTTHMHIERIEHAGHKPIFTSTKSVMFNLIEELIQHGKVSHSYTHPAGGKSAVEATAAADGQHNRRSA